MHIIEVLPLRKGIQIDKLSYFSSTAYQPGTLVEIPLRSKVATAMVLKSTAATGAKTALRAATFSLRKLPPQKNPGRLPDIILKTAETLARNYPAEVGAILYALLPAEIRNGTRTWPAIPSAQERESGTLREAPCVLEATRTDRYIEYRSLVRETFAHGGSVLLVVPTTADIQFAKNTLGNGIEDRVITFASALGKRALDTAYAAHEDFRKSKLIITTPAHAYLDRHDIALVLVDDARSSNYVMRTRPHLDHRDILTTYATLAGRKIVFGDILPRAEFEHRRREDIYLTHGEHPKRLALPAKLKLISFKDKPTAEAPFELLEKKLLGTLTKTLSEKGLVFMHAARRGLAPLVACSDCAYIFRCPDSGAPYSLLRTFKDGEEYRWFVSGASGKRIRAADVCPDCGSWRLKERGIGIQHIHDVLKKEFADFPIILFDHTTATTYKKAQDLVKTFYSAKRGAILLGTNMALPYLKDQVSASVVTSLDALAATPSWRNEEDLLGLLLTLREQSTDAVYVQSRHEVPDSVTRALEGSVEQFYDDELALRKMLAYPPFAVFVHLSWSGTTEQIQAIELEVAEALKDFDLALYRAPVPVRGKDTKYGLIRVTKDAAWPNQELLNALRTLPPIVKVVINPDRIV